MSRGEAFFYVIVGAPGAGKSSQIHCTLLDSPAPRLLVFDIEREYGHAGTVLRSTEALRVALIAAGPRGEVRLVYQPGTDDPVELRRKFDVFCRLAFAARNLLCVVDELADVDSPNPTEVVPGWAQLLRRGRKRGVQVLAGTQRPADVNKRLWSFATRLRVGRLSYSSDEIELAGALKVNRAEVAALLDTQWIERDRMRGTLTRGMIQWRRGRPVNVPLLAARPTRPARTAP